MKGSSSHRSFFQMATHALAVLCFLIFVANGIVKAFEKGLERNDIEEVWRQLSQCKAVNEDHSETIKKQSQSIETLEDLITKQDAVIRNVKEEMKNRLTVVETKINRLPDTQYDLNGVGCLMDVIQLDCVGNGTIAITNAIFGQYADSCSDCCTPSPRDCTVRMSDLERSEWLLLLNKCNDQTSCSHEYTGEVINECESGYVADYMQIFYTCPPDDVLANETVGFTARISISRSYYSGDIVLFDSVLTDLGNNYDPLNSTFTCPVRGMYVFSVSLIGSEGDEVHVAIMKGDDELIHVWADGETTISPTASAVIVTECRVGQDVYVMATATTGLDGGNERPHFSGTLIQSLQ